jgi:hypothetical protein
MERCLQNTISRCTTSATTLLQRIASNLVVELSLPPFHVEVSVRYFPQAYGALLVKMLGQCWNIQVLRFPECSIGIREAENWYSLRLGY